MLNYVHYKDKKYRVIICYFPLHFTIYVISSYLIFINVIYFSGSLLVILVCEDIWWLFL